MSGPRRSAVVVSKASTIARRVTVVAKPGKRQGHDLRRTAVMVVEQHGDRRPETGNSSAAF